MGKPFLESLDVIIQVLFRAPYVAGVIGQTLAGIAQDDPFQSPVHWPLAQGTDQPSPAFGSQTEGQTGYKPLQLSHQFRRSGNTVVLEYADNHFRLARLWRRCAHLLKGNLILRWTVLVHRPPRCRLVAAVNAACAPSMSGP